MRTQANANGQAGDVFFVTARFAPGVGMVRLTRGVTADAPTLGLTPLPGNQSNIDGLAFTGPVPLRTVYFCVTGATGQTWGASDIVRVDFDPATGAASPIRVWATAAQLGLGAGDRIDALAILNRDHDDLNAGDLVWVSLTANSPMRGTMMPIGEKIIQVFPGNPRLVLNARVLGVRPVDEVDALTAVDPAPNRAPRRDRR